MAVSDLVVKFELSMWICCSSTEVYKARENGLAGVAMAGPKVETVGVSLHS